MLESLIILITSAKVENVYVARSVDNGKLRGVMLKLMILKI